MKIFAWIASFFTNKTTRVKEFQRKWDAIEPLTQEQKDELQKVWDQKQNEDPLESILFWWTVVWMLPILLQFIEALQKTLRE